MRGSAPTSERTPKARPRIFGRLALGLLAVEVASGVALVPLYDPAHALADVEALEAGLPLGWLLRAVHGYAGWLLLIGAAAHVVETFWYGDERRLAPGVWWRAVLLAPILVLALLGGFLLRGDAEAQAAHAIWRGITDSVPLVGADLTRLFLGARGGSLGAVLGHHAGTFTVLLWVLSGEHGRRLFPDTVSAAVSALAVLALAAFVPLPLGPATAPAAGFLHGPWYLMGLQGALLDLPVWTGWIAPVVFVVALGLVRHVSGGTRRGIFVFLGLFLLAWLGFTLRLLGAS